MLPSQPVDVLQHRKQKAKKVNQSGQWQEFPSIVRDLSTQEDAEESGRLRRRRRGGRRSHGVVSRSKTEEVRDDRRGDDSRDAVSWKEVVVEDLKTLR